jgi:hypothetical protein
MDIRPGRMTNRSLLPQNIFEIITQENMLHQDNNMHRLTNLVIIVMVSTWLVYYYHHLLLQL